MAAPFGTFLDGWLRRYELTVRPTTHDRAVQALAHLRTFDALYVRQLSAASVEDRIAEIAKRAPRQAQMALRLLKQALCNAQERGQAVDPAIFGIKPPRYDEREPRFLTWEEVERLTMFCKEGRLILAAFSPVYGRASYSRCATRGSTYRRVRWWSIQRRSTAAGRRPRRGAAGGLCSCLHSRSRC